MVAVIAVPLSISASSSRSHLYLLSDPALLSHSPANACTCIFNALLRHVWLRAAAQRMKGGWIWAWLGDVSGWWRAATAEAGDKKRNIHQYLASLSKYGSRRKAVAWRMASHYYCPLSASLARRWRHSPTLSPHARGQNGDLVSCCRVGDRGSDVWHQASGSGAAVNVSVSIWRLCIRKCRTSAKKMVDDKAWAWWRAKIFLLCIA
jgi:hypothetical protein